MAAERRKQAAARVEEGQLAERRKEAEAKAALVAGRALEADTGDNNGGTPNEICGGGGQGGSGRAAGPVWGVTARRRAAEAHRPPQMAPPQCW